VGAGGPPCPVPIAFVGAGGPPCPCRFRLRQPNFGPQREISNLKPPFRCGCGLGFYLGVAKNDGVERGGRGGGGGVCYLMGALMSNDWYYTTVCGHSCVEAPARFFAFCVVRASLLREGRHRRFPKTLGFGMGSSLGSGRSVERAPSVQATTPLERQHQAPSCNG
jgi:hypothetical protein